MAIVLDFPCSDRSDLEPIQAAVDVIESQDTLIIIFEQIGDFFKPLEEHAEVPMTEALQDIIVKVMVEVLEIFAIMTAEINQGQSGESIPDDMSSVVDSGSGTSRERFFEELNEREGIKDKLSTLNRLMQDATKMATVILEVARLIKSGVGAAGGNVNQFTEGTFSTSFSLASLVVEIEIL